MATFDVRMTNMIGIELALWWRTNPNTWLGFGMFGTLSLLFCVASWRYWQQRDAVLNSAKTA